MPPDLSRRPDAGTAPLGRTGVATTVPPPPPPTLRGPAPVVGPSARRLWSGRIGGLLIAGAVLVLLVTVSVALGSRTIALPDVWHVLWHRDGSRDSIVVWQLRMPRTMLGVAVGAALGLAGAVMQALTNNPLADPGILGVNAGAAFAVVTAIAVFGVTQVTGYVWFAFLGAAVAALVVFGLGGRTAGPAGQIRLVLAGAALSASLGACTGIITMFNSTAFDSYRFWVVGSLDNRDAQTLGRIAPFLLVGVLLALTLPRQLNAMALGDDVGRALGVSALRMRLVAFTSVTLLCGAATAAAGPIGFVGLVVPHAVRLIVGLDQRWVLPYSLLTAPILVLASDIVGRVVARPGELEVGIVTAFVGAPVLLGLVVRRRAGRP
ncbi:iron chelate uptake ABC transporter family permease subunit [Micromonospora sp. NBC_01699]|uniref:FecCD family ABC transporter permease n=1 Tax=Micromonospora sp. NBC_01699 TaxID=2975984 RepID=UPI002E2F6393|nr:iron chelate uptake ABC transporter family permease subunit [Micromonospora sp. NBC_01699]